MSTNNESKMERAPTRQGRNVARNDRYRQGRGTAIDSAAKAFVYEKLWFGYKDLNDAFRGLHVTASFRSVIIPVSTRSIGFTVRILIKKILSLGIQNIDLHRFCCSLYRVGLALVEARLSSVQRTIISPNHGDALEFMNLEMTMETLRVLAALSINFKPLVNLIDAFGAFNSFGTQFIPRIPVIPAVNMINQIEPTTIVLSNLRATVVALSQVATNQGVRDYFREHDPFPNSIWTPLPRVRDAAGQIVANRVLLNPDDIMPINYGDDQLREDIAEVAAVIERICRKFPKYIHAGRNDFEAQGNQSLLVCNEVGNLRCSELTRRVEDGPPDYTIPPLTGNVNEFWSPEALGEPEQYFGILHLPGELPRVHSNVFNNRTRPCSKQLISMSYIDSLSNMLM